VVLVDALHTPAGARVLDLGTGEAKQQHTLWQSVVVGGSQWQ